MHADHFRGTRRRRRRTWAAGALLLALASAGTASAGAPPGEAPPQATTPVAAAARALHAQLDSSGIPGGAVVVVTPAGAQARGAGTTGDSRRVTGETPFVIGSTTKSFTALAIMQLVDAGRVDLDDPVRDHVPELRLAEGEPVDDITVRHLLQQTSGLSPAAAGPLLSSATDGTALAAVGELEGSPLESRPGGRWHYTNANYVLAGLVVERAAGTSYADYLQDHVLDPLGMADTHVSLPTAGAEPPTEGHRFWFGVPLASGPTHREGLVAAGYLISTAEDLGRYLSMYLAGGLSADGERIVSAAGLRTQLSPGPDAELGPWADGATSAYGMGWFIGGPWAPDAVFHPGNTPDSSAMLALFPDRGLAVATLFNAGHESPLPGNPGITDRASSNVVGAALGQDPAERPSQWAFYLVFDLVSVVLLVLASTGLVRAATALPARDRTPRVHRARRWVGAALRAVGATLLAVAVTVTLGWRSLWTWAPDLALVLTALVVLWATTAALRLLALILPARGRAPATPARTERKQADVPA